MFYVPHQYKQEYDAQAIPRFDGNDNAVANQDGGHGNNEGPSDISNEPVRRLFFSSPTELREIVDTLMGLSRIAQGNTAAQSCAGLYLVTSSSSPSSTTSKMGLRLACALAVLAIGMSGDMSQMDVSRKVGLAMTAPRKTEVLAGGAGNWSTVHIESVFKRLGSVAPQVTGGIAWRQGEEKKTV